MFGGCCNNRQNMFNMQTPIMEGQVVEPTITKCVEQEYYHEVPQE